MSSTTSTPPAESPMKPGDRRLLPPDVRKARLKERMEESEREATEYLNRKRQRNRIWCSDRLGW
jgi:hypothetical protein